MYLTCQFPLHTPLTALKNKLHGSCNRHVSFISPNKYDISHIPDIERTHSRSLLKIQSAVTNKYMINACKIQKTTRFVHIKIIGCHLSILINSKHLIHRFTNVGCGLTSALWSNSPLVTSEKTSHSERHSLRTVPLFHGFRTLVPVRICKQMKTIPGKNVTVRTGVGNRSYYTSLQRISTGKKSFFASDRFCVLTFLPRIDINEA